MKVFLSWSGHRSHEVAKVLREWIPSVLQSVTPYVSSEDIDKGARWSSNIAKELADSSFGILCVTKDNIDHPWLLFEAGALSKTMEETSVCPFLFDLKMSEIKEGPILQFQATIYGKDEIKKLMTSMNMRCGESKLSEELFDSTFDIWWPKLKEKLDTILKETQDDKPTSKKMDNAAILEELLTLTRMNQRLLRSPELLMPEDYLNRAIVDKISNYKVEANNAKMLSREIRLQCENIDNIVEKYRSVSKLMDVDMISEINHFVELVKRQQDLLYPTSRGRYMF